FRARKLRLGRCGLGCTHMRELDVNLAQISIGEFVAAAAGQRRFRVNYMPTQTLRSELHTAASHVVGLFCLSDEAHTFILHNRWVGGDELDTATGDYTEPVWETVVLRATAEAFEAMPTGAESTCRLEWPGGVIQWNTVSVEALTERGEPVVVGVGGALAYTSGVDGRPHEFLVELELPGSAGDWRLERSSTPSQFVLARHGAAA
ncbi:hypothetical protein, partial [Phenylobacterium sp. CCH12-B4]